MATAATMQATHIRPGPIPIAPSPSTRQQSSMSRTSSTKNKNQGVGDNGRLQAQPGLQVPCDGCRRRNSRCAINERAGKCYSCEFHRQDCTFTSVPTRKRSFDETLDGIQGNAVFVIDRIGSC